MNRSPGWSLVLLLAAPLALDAQIAQGEHRERRERLAAQVSEGVIFVPGGREPPQDYIPFHQTPYFRYLTGYEEPDAALVIVRRGSETAMLLFVQPRDPATETWSGRRLGTEGATRLTGIPARPARQLATVLDSLVGTGLPLHVVGDFQLGDTPRPRSPEQQMLDAALARRPEARPVSLNAAVRRMRGRKSPAELDLIRKAAGITVQAHREALGAMAPDRNEFEIQAVIEYTFRRYGAERPAFASIVGAGPNSTVLHYNRNDRFMRESEVVVMDIGASYMGYAADITRTIPVGGTFSAEQREIYQIVRDAQAAAEREARIGAEWARLTDASDRVLAQGLARLGLIESAEAVYDCGADQTCPQYRMYYMHGLGHGIGLDVHDPEQAQSGGTIQPGSAYTIEPGIYVRENVLEIIPDTPRNRALAQRTREAVRRYANIGVRIEDDYIVTEAGVEWISRAPREIAEIEAAMRAEWTGPAARDARMVEWYRARP